MEYQYVVKVENGNVKLYKSNGSYIRPICSGAVSAIVAGNEVHCTMANGRVRIYNVNGSYLREILSCVPWPSCDRHAGIASAAKHLLPVALATIPKLAGCDQICHTPRNILSDRHAPTAFRDMFHLRITSSRNKNISSRIMLNKRLAIPQSNTL